MEQERNEENPSEKHGFSRYESDEISPPGTGKTVLSDATGNDVSKIIDALPSYRQKPVQRPQIEMLPPVKPAPGPMGGSLPKKPRVISVDIRMMND